MNELFTQIAKTHLGIETLETRDMDRLDFHEVAVGQVEKALKAAYAAGREELLAAAETLLEARENQMETAVEWRRLRRAVRQSKKHTPRP